MFTLDTHMTFIIICPPQQKKSRKLSLDFHTFQLVMKETEKKLKAAAFLIEECRTLLEDRLPPVCKISEKAGKGIFS